MIQTIQNNVEPNYTLGSDKFCYWLQGFFEMTDAKELTMAQVRMIKDHLNMVFTHKVSIPAFSPLSPAIQGHVTGNILQSTVC
jgi:hypothetical protein